jgi:hypothetical protein
MPNLSANVLFRLPFVCCSDVIPLAAPGADVLVLPGSIARAMHATSAASREPEALQGGQQIHSIQF